MVLEAAGKWKEGGRGYGAWNHMNFCSRIMFTLHFKTEQQFFRVMR